MKDPQYELYVGDSREVLKTLPEHSVDAIITSPPFWGLRRYKAPDVIFDGSPDCEHEWGDSQHPAGYRATDTHPGPLQSVATQNRQNLGSNFCLKCGAWRGQLGSEPDPDLYIKHLCDIFDLCKRVLKKTGSMWVNLDDSYSANRGYQIDGTKQVDGSQPTEKQPQASDTGIPAKSLCAIPERFVLEMLKRGWIRRNTIIWKKDSCMPESVKDRFTVDFEYLFFFTQSQKYYFERQFEPVAYYVTCTFEGNGLRIDERTELGKGGRAGTSPLGRNRRSVWTINPEPQKVIKKGIAHYAAFPTSLCTIPILSTVPEQICTKCGKPRVMVYERTILEELIDNPYCGHGQLRANGTEGGNGIDHSTLGGQQDKVEVKEIGLSDCGCGASFKSGVVLDPFAGTGTTGYEARRLGRQAILIEISSEYSSLIEKRMSSLALPFGCLEG